MASVAARPAARCAAFVAVASAWRLHSLRDAAVATACVFALVFVLALVAQAFGGGRSAERGSDVELSAGCAVAGILAAVAFFVGIYFLVAP